MVVDNLILNLLFVFTVADYLENWNFTIFMERNCGDSNYDSVVCNKLVIS